MAEKVTAICEPRREYGYFDTENREYVVTDPMTPLPWINYLGSKAFFSIISNTGGGYSFYRDAKLRRLTRYRYDSVPLDDVGKYLYIVDGDTTWNPGWRPTRTTLDRYECRHGIGYSRFLSEKNALQSDLLVFVVDDANVELQTLRLTNNSPKKKTVKVFSYVEWCQWNAEDDSSNLQRNLSLAEACVVGDIVCHTTGYRERRNHYAFHTVNRSITGFDTDRNTFLGPYGELSDPEVVRQGHSSNSNVRGWWPIASVSVSLELHPGESDEIVFATGFAQNPEDQKWNANGTHNIETARLFNSKLANPRYVTRCFAELNTHWESLLNVMRVTTPEPEFDELINTWNPYQGMVNFELARSASLFETGRGRGIGFRDSNQDCLGVVQLVPERTRERLQDLAATQQSDGSAYHQYQPLTKTGNDQVGGGFNDDPLWLVMSVAAYVRETGELAFLDQIVPFEDTPTVRSTMRDHLIASLEYTLNNLGEHRLPLIGRADWNDCLNLNAHSTDPDESFQTGPMRSNGRAESVMIAALFVLAAREFATICCARDETPDARHYLDAAERMSATVERHGWDGEWFLRAYDDQGNAIGSHDNREGQIYAEPQGLCGMAGIGAEAGFVEQSLDSVAERLACDYGVQILYPPYQSYHKELGEISTYLPGYKENGAIFCHNNPWVIIAETRRDNGDVAMRYLRAIAPTYQTEVSRRGTEPYAYAQMVAGTSARTPGEAKNSWLTGTASWSYVAATQHILGVRADIDGLTVDPCIPGHWSGFTVRRVFRNAVYNIEVVNPYRAGSGVRSLTVDGKAITGTCVPLAEAGSTVTVRVELG